MHYKMRMGEFFSLFQIIFCVCGRQDIIGKKKVVVIRNVIEIHSSSGPLTRLRANELYCIIRDVIITAYGRLMHERKFNHNPGYPKNPNTRVKIIPKPG